MQVEQLPAPPKNWWARNKGRIAAGALIWVAVAIAIGALNGAGETRAPTAPVTIQAPATEAQAPISRADVVRGVLEDYGITHFSSLSDADFNRLGESTCSFLRAGGDTVVSRAEAAVVIQVGMDSFHVDATTAARLGGALTGAYCPEFEVAS